VETGNCGRKGVDFCLEFCFPISAEEKKIIESKSSV
jgi:hypothetical protein